MPLDDTQPTARLLLEAFRAFERGLLTQLSAVGYDDITYSDLNVLRHVDPGGIQLSRLATDAGLSKQAVGQTVRSLAGRGYLKIVADAVDARAKNVNYSAKGRRLINAAIHAVQDYERRYQARLGPRSYGALRKYLHTLAKIHT